METEEELEVCQHFTASVRRRVSHVSFLQTCYGFQVKVFKNEERQDGPLQSSVTPRNLGEWNIFLCCQCNRSKLCVSAFADRCPGRGVAALWSTKGQKSLSRPWKQAGLGRTALLLCQDLNISKGREMIIR